jgi:tRNA threonylcarbamoyladenosine biosynthesis protein TsaE
LQLNSERERERKRERITNSVDETRCLASQFGKIAEPGSIFLLCGDLGTGKTAFAQGLGAGLGVEGSISSPSFSLLKEYSSGRLPFFHADLYRVGAAALADIGLEDVINCGVIAVEWADLAPLEYFEEYLLIRFTGLGPESRKLTFEPVGGMGERLLEAVLGT